MKRLEKGICAAIFAGLIFGVVLSCENPFEKGLGEKINITPPVVQLINPVPGNYIQDITRIEGTATDDRGVTRIEIGVFDTIEDEAPGQWTSEGIVYDKVKNWYYDFDTSAWNGGKDGTIKLQFRVFDDGDQPVATAPLVYVIKNSPPELTLTTPAPGKTFLITGTTIRGQIRDRRGIRPGYPMIKFWKDGEAEPGEDGWVSVEIPGAERNDLAALGTARRTSEFVYTLKKPSGVNDGQHNFTLEDLELGAYKFRFKTRDYVTEADAGGNITEHPDMEKIRFDPPEGEEPYTVILVSSTESILFDLAPPDNPLPPLPHQYIDSATSYKKASSASNVDLFTLRVEISHSHGIDNVTSPPRLSWRHDTGAAAYTDISGNFTVTQKEPGNLLSPYILTYTANSSAINLPSHSVPYVFKIDAWSADGNTEPTTKEYTVYMAEYTAGALGPQVTIQSFKGAATEPSAASPFYTVNQTFEVGISYTGGDVGMRTVTHDAVQQPVLRWRLVQDGSAEQSALDAYLANPPRYNTGLADDVGAVLPAAAAETEYISGSSFKVDTAGKSGTWWLYILAQDQSYNVGWLRQKIEINQATDYPEIKINRDFKNISKKDGAETNWPPRAFAALEGDSQFSAWKTNNILRQGQTFDITLNDDDGLDIPALKIYVSDELAFSGGATLDPNGNPSGSPEGTFARKAIPDARILTLFNAGGVSPLRQITGTISQADIAYALYGNSNASLRDGVYRFDLEVKDRAADKMNTAEGVSTTLLSFWFALSAEGIDFPDDSFSPRGGTFVTAVPVPVTGIVKSRLQVKSMSGTTPDGVKTAFAAGTDFTLANVPQPPVAAADGYYTYTWAHSGTVNFGGGGSGTKTYTLEAQDRFERTAVKYLYLTLDEISPVVSLMPFETLTGNKVNGEIEFTFTVEEANGTREIRWWLSENGTTPPGWNEGFDADGNPVSVPGYFKTGRIGEGESYIVKVDTSAISVAADYYLYAAALDQAGNQSVFDAGTPYLQLMNIDQESDLPDVTTVDPPEETAVRSYGTDANPLTITGTVTDDDGFASASGTGGGPIDTAKNYVQIRFPATYNDTTGEVIDDDWAGWISVPGSIDSEGARAISFAFNLKEYHEAHPEIEYLNSDGRKYFQVQVTDDPARKGGVADPQPQSSLMDDCYFILDNEIPEYAPPANGLVFQNAGDAEGVLAGTLKEANLDMFEYNFYGDWNALDVTGTAPDYNWRIPGDALKNGFNSRPDGELIVQLRARDKAGNEIPQQWVFYKDTQGPEASFSSISRSRTVTVPAPGEFPANWPLDWPFGSQWQSAWTPAWKATIADWPSEYAFMTSDAVRDSLTTDNAGTVTVVSGDDPVILGNFWDRYSYIRDGASDAVTFSYRFDSLGRDDTSQWILGALNGGDADTAAPDAGQSMVFWTIPLTGADAPVLDGLHTFDIQVKDKQHNVTELYGLEFSVDRDEPEVYIDELPALAGNPDHIIGIGGASGDSTVVLALSGTAADALLTKVTVSLFSADGTSIHQEPYTATGASLNWSFNITSDDLFRLDDSDETQQRLTVVAEDQAGRQTVEYWYFYKDTKSPVISYTNLEKGKDGTISGNAFSNQLILKGTVEDYNKVKAVKYYIAKWDYLNPGWMNWNPSAGGSWDAGYAEPAPSGWDDLVAPASLGTKTVNWELDLAADSRFYSGAGIEGRYRIMVYAQDYSYHADNNNAGNPIVTKNPDPDYSDLDMVLGDPANPPSPRIFYIDHNIPGIEWSTETSGRQYYHKEKINGDDDRIEFTGTAADVNSVSRIRARFDNVNFEGSDTITMPDTGWGNWLDVTNNWLPATGGRAWRLVLNAPVLDGIHTLNLEITDEAGRTNYYNKEFTLDNVKPVIKVTQPQNNRTIVAGEVSIRGEGEDNGSLSAIRYWVGPEPADPDEWLPEKWQTETFNRKSDDTLQNVDLVEFDKGTLVWNLSLPDSTDFNLSWTEISDLVTRVTTDGTEGYLFKNQPIPAGETVLELPLWIGALDAAGNWTVYDADPDTPETTEALTLFVYPQGDKPTVTITNPDPAGDEASRLLGGTVRVYGEALDNAWVRDVYFRVLDTNNTPFTNLTVPNWKSDGTEDTGTQTAATLSNTQVNYSGSPAEFNHTGWYKASVVESSLVTWYVNINANSELNPINDGERRQVTIEFVAFDAFRNNDGSWGSGPQRISGPISRVSATFVKGAPSFAGERVFAGSSPAWSNAGAVSISNGAMLGKASYKVIVRDEGGINSLRWRKTTTSPWTELTTVDKTSYESGLDAALANSDNRGIVARAEPREQIDASAMVPNTWYMVMETGDTDWRNLSTSELTNNSDYTKYTTFKTKGSISPAGTGKVIPAVQADGTPITSDNQVRYYEWEITVDLDTSTLEYYDQTTNDWPGYTGKARYHSIYLQAQDITKPNSLVSNRTAALPIDYFYPQGIYTGNANAAGGNYSVQGTATDNGSGVQVQGIRKVVLWFNKDMVITGNAVTTPGTNYSLNGTTFTVPGGEKFEAVMYRTDEDKPASGNWDDNLLTYTLPLDDGSQSIVIDKDDPLGASGLPMGFSGSNIKEWYAEIDTTGLPSGPITLCYVVFDYAGNASFYQQRLIIKNNAPLIKAVTLGTDIFGNQGSGSVTTWAGLTEGKSGPVTIGSGAGNVYTPTDVSGEVDFKVRNNLLFFNVEMTAATASTRTFSLDYISGETAKEADELVQGNIYLITDVGTGTNWEAVGAPAGYKVGSAFLATTSGTPYGTGKAALLNTVSALRKTASGASLSATREFYYPAASFGAGADEIKDGEVSFILKVFDGPEADDFADITLLKFKVENTDIGPPDGRLYDLNPRTAELEGGAVPTDFTPAGIGENRAAPGLYYTNVNGLPASRSGHIEPRKTTFLSSAEMGGAATPAAGTVSRPYADKATFFDDDTVSGVVILRGYAENDQRLGNIKLSIGGTEFDILEKTTSVTPSPGKTGLLAVSADPNASGRVFFTDEIDLKSHRVEWAYKWDTETLPATEEVPTVVVPTVVGSANLKTIVYNNNPTPASNDDRPQGPSTESYTSIKVEVAPYITGLSRASTYGTARSTQGWYAFSQGETIALTGFNLKHPTEDTVVSLPSAANIAVGGAGTKNAVTFTVPTTLIKTDGTVTTLGAASGALGLTANGVKAVNTNTGTGAKPASHVVNPWNKESAASVSGSDLWEDFTSVHVWQSNDTAANADGSGTISAGKINTPRTTYAPTGNDPLIVSYPSMTVADAEVGDYKAGVLVGTVSYMTSNDTGIYFIQSGVGRGNTRHIGDGTSTYPGWTQLFNWVDPVIESDTVFNTTPYTVYNIQGRWLNDTDWYGIGGIYVKGLGGNDNQFHDGRNGENHYLVEKAKYRDKTDQFANPHIAVHHSGSGAAAGDYDLHVAYHDVDSQSIKYRYIKGGSPDSIVNGNTSSNTNTNLTNATIRKWINLDGGIHDDGTQSTTLHVGYQEDVVGYGANSSRVAAHGTGQPARSANAGFHNAIDVTSNGHPVIAYFDEASQVLKLAYCSDTGSDYLASKWTIMEVFGVNDPNRLETGAYVTMRIDRASGGNNKIHIAAYNAAKSALVYTSGTWNANAAGAPVFGDSLTVDTSAGSRADISLDSTGNPWITYADNNEVEGYNKLKAAYLDAGTFTRELKDSNGRSIAGWEALTIPLHYEAKDERLSVENFPVRGSTGTNSAVFWNTAVGYLTKDAKSFRVAYRAVK
jgi:hypothetical protein